MFSSLQRLFGDPTAKKLKNYLSQIQEIRAIEEKLMTQITTIEQVQEKTKAFQELFIGLDIKNEEDASKIKSILDDIKFEALALHSLACRLIFGKTFLLGEKEYVWNMIPFDVQIAGALALHDGNISEMKTGEGKTLVATLAAYLNALAGFPVHIVTVNDYLAKRDSQEMGIIYGTLGLTTGVILHNQSTEEKQQQYACNIVYATNNEIGFDYLRDNMVAKKEKKVMKELFYAIVDEVDSILVDEARTPLIISAPDSEPTTKYLKFAQMAKVLKREAHYKIDEKQKTATLTEEGMQEIERMLWVENIYISDHYNDVHHIENALKAHTVYVADVDYLVRNDEILIIDEHTGRVLPGRRYSNGLHQAIEAKEGVEIQQESRTLASITFQNYFRLYRKLSGMTGTAKTEEEEFYKIYGLEVIVVPTNRPMIREDKSDLLFKNEVGKFAYLVKVIKEFHKVGQPILVGTVSVAKSEYLSDLLTKEGVPHNVLNAKQDAREAEIISQAGQFGSITIATNMAGRGTDIKISDEVRNLTGSIKIASSDGRDFVYNLGGLVVIGTEKHETRRIDNQLRGRSGRQGDPGISQFLVSPQDDIMRIFGGDRLFSIFNSPMFASLPADDPLLESKMLTGRIDGVQKQVEGRNFDVRKHILEYDDVLNNHRIVIYSRRDKILANEAIHEDIVKIIDRQVESLVEQFEDESRKWDREDILKSFHALTSLHLITEEDLADVSSKEELREYFVAAILKQIASIQSQVNEEDFATFERNLYLQSIDELWMEHIDAMSSLREEVAFEGYAQKNPLIVYKERAYEAFVNLLAEIEHKVIKGLLNASPNNNIAQIEFSQKDLEELLKNASFENDLKAAQQALSESTGNPLFSHPQPAEEGVRVYRVENNAAPKEPKKLVGRNEPCPCGSGKKYKHCCGK